MAKLSEMSVAYKRLPQLVIADLANKCFAGSTTFDLDPRVHALNEGKRQVWLHINTFLGLTQEQVARLYQGLPVEISTEGIENGGW